MPTMDRLNFKTKPPRTFASERDMFLHDIACETLTRAVRDWKELEYGALSAAVTDDYGLVYRHELVKFFHSKWFDILVANVTDYHGDELREVLRVPDDRH